MLESLPFHHQPLIKWVLENTLNWAEVPPPVPTHPFVTTLIKHPVTQAPRTLASPPRWSHSGWPAAWFVSCDIAGEDAHPSGQRHLGNAEVNAGWGGEGGKNSKEHRRRKQNSAWWCFHKSTRKFFRVC